MSSGKGDESGSQRIPKVSFIENVEEFMKNKKTSAETVLRTVNIDLWKLV
jgi:hypothetical protein